MKLVEERILLVEVIYCVVDVSALLRPRDRSTLTCQRVAYKRTPRHYKSQAPLRKHHYHLQLKQSLVGVLIKNEEHATLVKDYRSRVESELSNISAGILKLLDSHLIPSIAASESKVFYLTMKGDYHRYFAEFKVGAKRKEVAEDTMLAYKAAQDIAVAELLPTHPIRLGLALNFSVFYYEILNSSEKACSMAKQVRIFTEMEDPLLDAIYERLKQKLYIQGSKVLYQGAPIDKMVFIV